MRQIKSKKAYYIWVAGALAVVFSLLGAEFYLLWVFGDELWALPGMRQMRDVMLANLDETFTAREVIVIGVGAALFGYYLPGFWRALTRIWGGYRIRRGNK